jgi:hypothetical protein
LAGTEAAPEKLGSLLIPAGFLLILAVAAVAAGVLLEETLIPLAGL